MATILINSFKGGIAPYEDRGLPGAAKFLKGVDIRKTIDSLSCQQALAQESPVSGSWTNLIVFIVPATNGKAYGFTRDGKIYERDSTTKQWTLVYTDTNESSTGIIGAAEGFEGTQSFLYWATATRLNRKPLPGNGVVPWSDVNTGGTGTFPKTNLTSASWHTMKYVVGNLLICNANTLAKVTYSDSSYSNNVLQLIPGNLAKTLIERNRTAIIGCDRKDLDEVGPLFLWDTISNNWNDKKLVPIRSVNAMIDTDLPLMQVGSLGQIFYSDFAASPVPLVTMPGGGQVNPDGVCNDAGLSLWGFFGNGVGKTGIYSYGKRKNGDYSTLNLEYPFDCDEIGSVCKIGTEKLVSYRVGSSYFVARVDTTTKASGVYESLDLKAPDEKYRGKVLNWRKIVVNTSPLPAGCSLSMFRRTDKNGAFSRQCNLTDGSTSFTTTNGTEAVFLAGDSGKIFEFQLNLLPSGNLTPEVHKIEVIFD